MLSLSPHMYPCPSLTSPLLLFSFPVTPASLAPLSPLPPIRHCSLPQACRNKMVQHLEHLLFYGADMNAQNASGNTPLHVCAVNNLEDCARVLLFRGCNKNAINYANQTPYQVRGDSCSLDWTLLCFCSLPESCHPPVLFMLSLPAFP